MEQQNIYDNEEFFNSYQEMRQSTTVPNANDLIEIPQLFELIGDVKGKTCIIVDDIVDTAGTLCLAANKLQELGDKEVYAAITHGVLSDPAVDRIKASCIKKLVITDSIPLSEEKKCDKIDVLGLAPMYAKIICAIEDGKSLSDVHQSLQEEALKN